MGDGWGPARPGADDTRRQRIAFRVAVAALLVFWWASAAYHWENAWLWLIGFFCAVAALEQLVMWINRPDE